MAKSPTLNQQSKGPETEEPNLKRFVRRKVGFNKFDVYEQTLAVRVVSERKVEASQSLAIAQERIRKEEAHRIRREALL